MSEITICREVWFAITSSFRSERGGRRAYIPSPETLTQAINDDLILHHEKGASHPGGTVTLTDRRLELIGLQFDAVKGLVVPRNGNGNGSNGNGHKFG